MSHRAALITMLFKYSAVIYDSWAIKASKVFHLLL